MDMIGRAACHDASRLHGSGYSSYVGVERLPRFGQDAYALCFDMEYGVEIDF